MENLEDKRSQTWLPWSDVQGKWKIVLGKKMKGKIMEL
jgi:hypothetical protein